MALLAQEKEPVLRYQRVERRALRFPVREELADGARIHHRAREDVRADLGAFLQHAHRDFGVDLLRADGGRETGRPGADDDDVVVHRFARHAAIIIGAPMTASRKLVHVERIAIRWGDMDAMGHVNNTVYFRYMEQARISWFDALVPEQEAWKSTGIVIANASCNSKRAMTYPGTVEIKVYTDAPGGSSVPTFYELSINGEVYADGAATVVFIDMQKQKPVRIPQAIRKVMQ